MPDAVIRPFREAIDSRKVAEKVTVDPGKLLEQTTVLRQQAAKRRDDLKAAVADTRTLLTSREAELALYERGVEILQQQMSQLMLETSGAGPAPKRTGQPPQGLTGNKSTLEWSAAELLTPEYDAYRAAAEAAGKELMEPLRWHLLAQLGPLDTEDVAPPPRRPCK